MAIQHKPRQSSPTPKSEPAAPVAPQEPQSGRIGENIAAVHEFYEREELKRGAPQRHAESIGGFVGQPAFLVMTLVFTAAWTAVNLLMPVFGMAAVDPAPFFWMQGVLGLASLLTTTVVLIKQNRVGKLSEQRAHLDLKVMLLIEQKVAKVIHLMEELRRDLPDVRHRHDGGAVVMQHAMSPEKVVAALDEKVVLPDGSTAGAASSVVS